MKKFLLAITLLLLPTLAWSGVLLSNITTNSCATQPIYDFSVCAVKSDNTTITWNIGAGKEFVVYAAFVDSFKGSSSYTTITCGWINTAIDSVHAYLPMSKDVLTTYQEPASVFIFDNSTQYNALYMPASSKAKTLSCSVSIDNSTRCPNLSIKGDYF